MTAVFPRVGCRLTIDLKHTDLVHEIAVTGSHVLSTRTGDLRGQSDFVCTRNWCVTPPYIFRAIKAGGGTWVEHVARAIEVRNVWRCFVGNPEGKN
jgi:hypothetical protein